MEGDPAGGAARERRGRGGAHPPFPSRRRPPAARPPAAPPRLSEDPSGHPPRPELFAKLAAAYGSSLAWRGRALAERLVPLRRLKCYFAVDTRYVEQKLGAAALPLRAPGERGRGPPAPFPPPSVCLSVSAGLAGALPARPPVAPRFDVNAPDLYIPGRARTGGWGGASRPLPPPPFLPPQSWPSSPTCWWLGWRWGDWWGHLSRAGSLPLAWNPLPTPAAPCRFSPDLLGLLASSTLAWLIMEVLAILVCLYLVAVNTELTPIDLIAFSGYKYVGMIAGLLAGLLFGKTGYYMLLRRSVRYA